MAVYCLGILLFAVLCSSEIHEKQQCSRKYLTVFALTNNKWKTSGLHSSIHSNRGALKNSGETTDFLQANI